MSISRPLTGLWEGLLQQRGWEDLLFALLYCTDIFPDFTLPETGKAWWLLWCQLGRVIRSLCVLPESYLSVCAHLGVELYALLASILNWSVKTLWNDYMMIQHWNQKTAYTHKVRKRPKFLSVKQLGEKEGSELNTFFRTTTNLFHLYFAFYVYINSKIERKKLSANTAMLKILSDGKALNHNFIGSVFCFLMWLAVDSAFSLMKYK